MQICKAPPFSVPTWVRPIVSNSAKTDMPLAGGWTFAREFDVVTFDQEHRYEITRLSQDELIKQAFDRNKAIAFFDQLYAKRPDFAGLDMTETHLMGVINVTPDSFSDGGKNLASPAAIANGMAMSQAGASIIDIGGESTRPGADSISRNQELARILPIITGLARQNLRVSVDTRHAVVMTRACDSGACIINDIEALRREGAVNAATKIGVPVVIMHMQGKPENMQDNPNYEFAPIEIYQFLEDRVQALTIAGIPKSNIAIDPGFGFGKSLKHNLQIVNWLSLFHGLGVPLLFGASRKSTISKISQGEPVDQRLAGSLVLASAAFRQGVQIHRVHDVAETAQALAVERKLLNYER